MNANNVMVDAYVTIPGPDADGMGDVLKRLKFATVEDMRADTAWHETLPDGDDGGLERARFRDRLLIPLMETHGYQLAGAAIEHLERAERARLLDGQL